MPTVDLKFTWTDVVPLIIVALQDGTPEGRRQAEEQLRQMAWLADLAFKPLSVGLDPMCKLTSGDHVLAGSPELVDYYDVDVRIVGEDPIWESEGELNYQQAQELFEDMKRKFPQAEVDDLAELL